MSVNTHQTKREQELLDALRSELKPYVGDRTRISARELWMNCVGPDKSLSWIRSYKTLLKYVSEKYKDTFDPIIIGEGSGTRYYVELENVAKFLYKFENHDFTSTKK